MAQTNDEETSFEKEVIIKKTESSKEYQQYAIAKRPPDDIGRIYLGLGSNPDKRYGYWIGRMVQRDYQDAEVVCAKRESRLAALDDCKTLLERVLLENKKKMLHASEELHKAYAIGSQFNLFALDTEDKQRKASKRLSDMEKHIANARNTIDLSEIIITKNGTEFRALAELEALTQNQKKKRQLKPVDNK